MEIPIVKIGPISGQTMPTFISLREGQVVKALVAGVAGDDVVLNLNGTKILAQGALDLAPEQSLLLEAVQVRPEGIVFKLLEVVTSGKSELESAAPANLLSRLELPLTPLNNKIAGVLMAHGLPVTREAIEQIGGELKGLPLSKLDTFIHTAAFVKNTDLPETKELGQLLLKFFSGEAEPEEIAQTLKLLNETKNVHLTQPNLYCIWWQNGPQQGELYLWTEQEKHQGQLESFKTVVLHFYTEHLGELWIRLGQFPGKLNLDVTIESLIGQQLFKKHVIQLEALLSSVGYELDQIKYTVGKVDSVFALTKEEQKTEQYKGIDVKV